MAQAQLQRRITLRGSAQIIREFFDFSINNILFQRALYPPEDFRMTSKYGLNLLRTADDAVQSYLREILQQVERWVAQKAISKLVLVISSRDTREVVERWQFNIELENDDSAVPNENERSRTAGRKSTAAVKTEKEINAEIAAIMRQITSSVSFLPVINEPCTFNILAYTDKDAQVPTTWEDSDARLISKNAEQVRLRSFSTSVHKVDALVAYKFE